MTSQPAFNENFFYKMNLRQRKANLRLIKSSKNEVITPYDNLKVSEEIYWSHYYEYPDRHFEWKNGYLEEKPVGDFKNIRLAAWLDLVIKCFLNAYPIAKVVQLEFAFRMVLSTGISIRKPDFAVVLNDNPVILKDDDKSYKGTFDLCIESISDCTKKGIQRDTVYKKKEYLQSGVKEYYILDESGKEMAFYRLNNNGEYENIKPVDGDIIKSKVLPGFQFRISDLYKQPLIQEMAKDQLYQNFVFPFYKEEIERADREKKRADREKRRADLEKERADLEKERADKAEYKIKVLEEQLLKLSK